MFDAERMAELLFDVFELKRVMRTGWLERGAPPTPHVESAAEHSWALALLVILLPVPDDLDRERLLRLALVHDLPEARTGDPSPLTPYLERGLSLQEALAYSRSERGRVEAAERKLAEKTEQRLALQLMLRGLPGLAGAQEAWQEYEQNASAEARYLRLLHALTDWAQALIYFHQGIICEVESFRPQFSLEGVPVFLRSLATALEAAAQRRWPDHNHN